MAATRKQASREEATLPPERAIRALENQLQRLQTFKGRSARDVKPEEDEWLLSTEAIVARAFRQSEQKSVPLPRGKMGWRT